MQSVFGGSLPDMSSRVLLYTYTDIDIDIFFYIFVNLMTKGMCFVSGKSRIWIWGQVECQKQEVQYTRGTAGADMVGGIGRGIALPIEGSAPYLKFSIFWVFNCIFGGHSGVHCLWTFYALEPTWLHDLSTTEDFIDQFASVCLGA